jgi:hypothetical protein
MHKALEFTPTYRAAGKDPRQSTYGYFCRGGETMVCRRLNLFPDFTPGFVYRWLGPFEPSMKKSHFWNTLCSVDLYGLSAAET